MKKIWKMFIPIENIHEFAEKWQTSIYLLKVNNGDTRTMSEIYSSLTIKTTYDLTRKPRYSSVFKTLKLLETLNNNLIDLVSKLL